MKIKVSSNLHHNFTRTGHLLFVYKHPNKNKPIYLGFDIARDLHVSAIVSLKSTVISLLAKTRPQGRTRTIQLNLHRIPNRFR